MKKVKCRKAKKEDLKRITGIFRTESAKKPYMQRWTRKKAFQRISRSFKNYDIHVAEMDGKVTGFIISYIKKGKTVFIYEFWIGSQYQNKGIGKSLLGFIEKKYKKRGEIYIDLIANQKSESVNFYKKLGYKTKQWLLYMNKKLK